jgi:hypothetical protein
MCALVLVVLSPTRRSRTLAAIGPESMFHHDAAYEAALRALNTAAYVRPFVLYFNLMDHARAPLPAALVRRGDRGLLHRPRTLLLAAADRC